MTVNTAEPRFHVIFRACDLVLAVNGAPRPFNLDKRSLVELCFDSLYEALRPVQHTITVLGDKLSPELTAFFERYPGVRLLHGSYGNSESIRQTFKLADALPEDDWIYFCEDDYLHVPHAFEHIRDFIVEGRRSMQYRPRIRSFASFIDPAKQDLVIFPPDYPDRYLGKNRRFSLVFHGALSHWRQVSNTTFTFLMHGRTFRKHRQVLERSATGANDAYLCRRIFGRYHFFGRAMCVSPIPALSTHMHQNTMSPVVDWDAVVQRLRARTGP
jgi:hypothetical protein